MIAVLSAAAWSQTYVQPHVTKNGTYVEGYHKTAPNDTKMDNYSTQGNTNPYTGQAGTVNPYNQPTNQIHQSSQPANIWGTQPAKSQSPY